MMAITKKILHTILMSLTVCYSYDLWLVWGEPLCYPEKLKNLHRGIMFEKSIS